MTHEGTRHYVVEREPTEGEAMAPVRVVDVPEYADHELGCMVRMAIEGAESGEIAAAIGEGVTARAVARKLTHIRLVLQARHRDAQQKPHRATGRPAHRPSRATAEQWETVLAMRDAGLGVQATVVATGLTVGQVRHMREAR